MCFSCSLRWFIVLRIQFYKPFLVSFLIKKEEDIVVTFLTTILMFYLDNSTLFDKMTL